MKNPFRRLHYWAQTVFYSMFFLGILIFIFILVQPFNRVFDLSAGARFSLKAGTVDTLSKLSDSEVKWVGFFKDNDPVIREVEAQAAGFRRYLPKLRFTHYDLEKKPDQAKAYGVHEYGILLAEGKGRRAVIRHLTEEGIREAFEKITDKKRPIFFFSSGHGEPEITDRGILGYSFIKDALANNTYVVKQDFVDSPAFSEADLVIVGYPKKDFTPYEVDRLREHLKTKNAFFMIDPEESGVIQGLTDFLGELGVELDNCVILDRTSRMYGADDLIPVVTNFTHHKIVQGFENPLFFPLARSVRMKDVPSGSAWEKDYLIFSGDDSWGETAYNTLEEGNYAFDKDKDIKGPLALGLALERKGGPKNRVLILGDSDFINNTNFNVGGNRLLFLNSVSWLMKEKLYFGEKTVASNSEPWVLGPNQNLTIFLSLIVLPTLASFIIFGLILARRRLK